MIIDVKALVDALLGSSVPDGTCCGCSNIGHDAVSFLAIRFPEVSEYVESLGITKGDGEYAEKHYRATKTAIDGFQWEEEYTTPDTD